MDDWVWCCLCCLHGRLEKCSETALLMLTGQYWWGGNDNYFCFWCCHTVISAKSSPLTHLPLIWSSDVSEESVLCADLSERLFLLIICSSSFCVSSAVCADDKWMNCVIVLSHSGFLLSSRDSVDPVLVSVSHFTVFKYCWIHDEQNENKTFQKTESIQQKRHWNKTNVTTTFL